MINDPSAFAFWLNGFVELHGQPPTPAQWDMIKEHLALVFTKVTGKPKEPARPAAARTESEPRYCYQAGGGNAEQSAESKLDELRCSANLATASMTRLCDLVSEGAICGTTEFPLDLSKESSESITNIVHRSC